MKRARVDFKKPLHLTLKLSHKNWNLRCRKISDDFKLSACGAKKFGLRVLHYAILREGCGALDRGWAKRFEEWPAVKVLSFKVAITSV